ncbi:MAG TPA: branched-chain amino acid ABC transporter permease, partial [Burkholderiaceae bacterium]|nr:branched-chain amino acid ABC transporter permease [Burkholderiaceae bacterium]
QHVLREFLPPQWASAAGPAIASIAVYVFMAVVLAVRPQGLFPARS